MTLKTAFCSLSLLMLLISSATFKANAQPIGSVHGRVMEGARPLEFASVFLFAPTDTNKVVSSSITDSSGFFDIRSLRMGGYVMKVQLVGYLPRTIPFVLMNGSPELDAGNILLTATSRQLGPVIVTGQKNIVQRTPQGLVLNAAANITQLGGTATDLLRNTPTVVVDAEGAITLRGKSPMILINGRNSSMANTDQIPASSIESIEVIYNPSAQYDADAEGGIINIKLKKNKQRGTNGAVALGVGAGAKGRINSSVMLNHKTNKWNYALAYDNRFAGRTRTIEGKRVNYDLPDNYYLLQHRDDDRKEQLQNLRLNADLTIDPRTTLGLEAIGSIEGQDNDENLTNTLLTKATAFKSKGVRRSIEIGRSKVAEFAMNYNRKYADKRKSLSANISSSFNYDRENTDITSNSYSESNALIGSPYLQRTANKENTNVTNIKTDLVLPVSSHAVIQTGYKAILRHLDADFRSMNKIGNDYVADPLVSNVFTYNEQIHAAYVQWSGSAGPTDEATWNFDLGLRAEQVWNTGKGKSNGLGFKNDYFNLFPSLNVVHHDGPSSFSKLSYSRRINRPGLGQLNPFIDITDSLNQHGGNPDLRPELIHSIELGYNKEWGDVSLYSMLYYRYATNTIRTFTVLKPNGVALTQPFNFGNAITYGIENVLTAAPAKHYDLNLSVSMFHQHIKGNVAATDVVNDVFSWYGKLINNFTPWKNGKLQVIGVYNSPVATPQGKRIAVYNVDLGFQQKLGKGNGRIGLVITDLFNTQKAGYNMMAGNFTYDRTSKSDTRAVLLTFAFTFGTSFKESLMENKFSND